MAHRSGQGINDPAITDLAKIGIKALKITIIGDTEPIIDFD
jgi:hypothetical protein